MKHRVLLPFLGQESIARPLKRSRLPRKYASIVESSRLLPKRRGRDRKTDVALLTNLHTKSVLSRYLYILTESFERLYSYRIFDCFHN